MKIFLSYAREQRPLAEELAARLEREHHEVFYDRDDIRPGSAFDQTIESGIRAADLFIFLISPQSVAAGRYSLSELKAAKEAGRGKRDFVWGVQVEPTPKDDVPPFLKSGSLFFPQGEPIAEILQEVRRRQAGFSGRRRRVWVVAGLATTLGAGVLIYKIPRAPSQSVPEAVRLDAAQPDAAPRPHDARPHDARVPADRPKGPKIQPIKEPKRDAPPPSGGCAFTPKKTGGRWFLACVCDGEEVSRHPLTDIADDDSTAESLRRPALELAARVKWRCP
jgi:hypothetical protein